MAFEPKHSDLLERYADRFGLPNQGDVHARDWTLKLAQQFRHTFGDAENWGTKSTSPTSPQSTDVIARHEAGLLVGYDTVISAGIPSASLNPHPEPLDIRHQNFIAVSPVNHLGDQPQPQPCLLAYSLFWGVGAERIDPQRFDEQLREYKDHGADAVRIIAHLPRTNADGTPGVFNLIGVEWSDPDFVDLLKRADDRLQRHGLKWYLTFTAGIRGIENVIRQEALVDSINEAFIGRPGRRLLDEMANEYETNGLTTTIVRSMCRRNAQYSERAQWVSLSSPNSVHDGSGRSIPDEVRRMYDGLPEGTAITPHWNRSTNQPPDLGPYAPPIVWSGEPRGPMSSGTQTNNPADLVGDYQKAVTARYTGYVGHSDSGFISTFMYPQATPDHGRWRLYSNHESGAACLAALRDFRGSGTIPEPGEPVIPYDEAKSIDFGLACNDVYTESGAPFDPGMVSVHSSRAAWDHYVGGLSWEQSKRKHINEFRAVYGLPPI